MATLPVMVLAVGIGVDYALYLLSVQLAQQRKGLSLGAAYQKAVQFTGKVVALVGVTLAAGVFTWAFSPIKFQADMGILLTFMFALNMVGALVLAAMHKRLSKALLWEAMQGTMRLTAMVVSLPEPVSVLFLTVMDQLVVSILSVCFYPASETLNLADSLLF